MYANVSNEKEEQEMKMLDMDSKDVKKLTKLTKEEAYQFLEKGMSCICRVSSREFQQVVQKSELQQLERLEDMGIYKKLEFYQK